MELQGRFQTTKALAYGKLLYFGGPRFQSRSDESVSQYITNCCSLSRPNSAQ